MRTRARLAPLAAVAVALALVPVRPALAATFTVNAIDDTPDALPGDGFCENADGQCSLRAAIEEANAAGGADTIAFAIPSGGVPTIPLAGPLPDVSDPLTVDGTTQAAGRVIVHGAGTGVGSHGLVLAAGDSTVRGIEVRAFPGHGIRIASSDNLVTETTLTLNALAGVAVEAGERNRITANAITDNAGLGIDLVADDETPGTTPTDNDADDADDGPNGLQNFPVVTLVETSADGTTFTVTAEMAAAPSAIFTLEFFANTGCDATDHGEGAVFLGAVPLSTDDQGMGAVTTDLARPADAGVVVTATATDAAGNTSEFSRCRPAEAPTTTTSSTSTSTTSSTAPATTTTTTPTTTTTTTLPFECLSDPGGLAADGAGNLYVSNRARGSVTVFAIPEEGPDGRLGTIDHAARAATDLTAPGDIDVNGCSLFVGEPHDLKVVPLGLSGTLTDAAGAPVAGATVEVVGPPGAGSRAATTDGAGEFRLNVSVFVCRPLAQVFLSVQTPGDETVRPETFVQAVDLAPGAGGNAFGWTFVDLQVP